MQRLCLFVTGGKKLLIRGFKFHYVNFCPHSSHPQGEDAVTQTGHPAKKLTLLWEAWRNTVSTHKDWQLLALMLFASFCRCVRFFPMILVKTNLSISFLVEWSFINLDKLEKAWTHFPSLGYAPFSSKPLLSLLSTDHDMSSLQLPVSLCSRMMLMQQFIFLCRGGSPPTVTLTLIPANPALY